MKKRHLVKPELEQLEEELRKNKNDRMVHIIHQVGHLLNAGTSLNEAQFTEVLHLLHAEAENRRSVDKVVVEMTTLINGLYQTHLLSQLFTAINPKVHLG